MIGEWIFLFFFSLIAHGIHVLKRAMPVLHRNTLIPSEVNPFFCLSMQPPQMLKDGLGRTVTEQ